MAANKKVDTAEPSFKSIVSTYSTRFGKNDDQSTVTEEERRQRQTTAAEGTDQYYDFATSAYEFGWSTHFHYTPFFPVHESIEQAMAFYEHRLAHLMQLRPGMKVLDVGCGVGGPAREIAKFIGCEIVGITINQRQVERARELTREAGLQDKCVFVRGDFLDLPFPDASFDAAYAIEATVHAPSLRDVYTGIARVLKPGAVFGLSEWVMTPSFDPVRDENHVGIRNRIERGNAISNLQTVDVCRDAVRAAGFSIFHDEDYALHWNHLGRSSHRPSIPGHPSPPHPSPTSSTSPPSASSVSSSSSSQHIPPARPWYFPLAGQTSLTTNWTDYRTTLLMTPALRKMCYALVFVLEHLRLYPRGTLAAMTTMAYCVDSVVEGGREGCFSPCWWIIGRKEGG